MNLSNVKWIVGLIALCATIWFVKDYIDKVQFKKDTEANQLADKRFDSLRISYIKLTDAQMMSHIKEKSEYKQLLKENNIKMSRVTSILNSVLKYRDTTIVNTDLSPILNAIGSKQSFKQPFKDSTACMVIKGVIEYKYDEFGPLADGSHVSELKHTILSKQFNGETTAIGFWEHNKWRIPILGIKTRILGKKIITAKVVDKCGESKTIIIEKAK
jgi:hypothetical protein